MSMNAGTQQLDRQALHNATGGDLETSQELLRIFLVTVPRLMSELESASERADPAALRFGAHNLKNSLALVGAVSLAVMLERLETTCRSTSQEQWQPVIACVREATDRLMDEIRELLNEGAIGAVSRA
jgi:HPt (histidine-containing phosphotransfer) domain-containing protein